MRHLISFFILTTSLFNNLWAQKPFIPYNTADSIVSYAKSLVGVPYQFGGNSDQGFDCSGFVSYVFGHFNINTPRESSCYYNLGISVPIDSCRKGDLILFTGTNIDTSTVGHVGIIISEYGEPIRFIHSSSSKNNQGVTITEYLNSGYQRRFIGIRRLVK
jgi:cell wall-associated NlpC family hydrolase